LRDAEAGSDTLDDWLARTLACPKLPPSRAKHSVADDERLISAYDMLRRQLRPMFKAKSAAAVKAAAAPIVGRVLGRPFSPAMLPDARTSAEFCYAVLGTTPVTLSRIRRRRRQYALTLAVRIKELLIPAIRVAEQRGHHDLAARAKRELDDLGPYLLREHGITLGTHASGRDRAKSERASGRHGSVR
jgi:hypothetical protein